MENWPKPKWGHPLPAWSKYLKPRAAFWLSSLAILTVLGIIFSYIYSEIRLAETPRAVSPDNVDIPLSGEYFFQAVHFTEVTRKDAQVVSITLVRDQNKSNKIVYRPTLEFCSLKYPKWGYQITVKKFGYRVLPEDRYSFRFLTEENVNKDCENNGFYPPKISSITAMEIAQNYMKKYYEGSYEFWPNRLDVRRDEDKLLHWSIKFRGLDDGNDSLIVFLNASTGDFLKAIETRK